MGKVFVFGIDGAVPELVFDKWVEELPNIKKLMERGSYTKMNSTVPPNTIIAWNSMFSGRDPSEIGVYNYTFRDEKGNSKLVSSQNVKCERIWDILGKVGKKTISLFVPLTYPVKPIKGIMVSDFLTPEINDRCVYPVRFKENLKALGNEEVLFDVVAGLAGHKSLNEQVLVDRTIEMTEMQHKFAKEMLVNESWDLFIMINIGSDRLHHMLWRHFDSSHRRFIPNSKFKDVIKNYYIDLDKKLGELMKYLDEDTTIIIASDHGMIKQEGKININNWLIQEGYLFLKEECKKEWAISRFKNEWIDLDKTVAWGGGAYNARVYINKEKVGLNYEKIRKELTKKLKSISGDKGQKLDTKIYKAEEVYIRPDKECPDLTIYFDDLRWASNPDLNQEGLYSWETAIGADSAGHSRQGCFIISGKNILNKGKIKEVDIAQVMPTILKLMGIEKPKDIRVEEIKDVFA